MVPEPRGNGALTEVLYGHRIADRPMADHIGADVPNIITGEEFERFLESRVGWRALSAEEFEARVMVCKGMSQFLLTLDDGYRDNLTKAVPILERFGVPVLIFVTTGFVDGSVEPAEHVIARIVRGCSALRLPNGRTLGCGSVAEKRAVYAALKPKLKRKSTSGRRRLLDSLAALNAVDIAPAESAFLTWDDVRRLDQHPLVTIGAHSRSHPLLTALSPLEAYAEIRSCKTELESKLDHTVDCFAYPYGGHNTLVRWLVSLAGFNLAFATGQRPLLVGSKPNRLRIPRLDLKKVVAEVVPFAGEAT